MKDNIVCYLDYLDKVLDNIPKKEKMLLKEVIDSSYSLIDSKNILIEIQYLDYLFCLMLSCKYINYKTFLDLGKKLENIILVLKVSNSF